MDFRATEKARKLAAMALRPGTPAEGATAMGLLQKLLGGQAQAEAYLKSVAPSIMPPPRKPPPPAPKAKTAPPPPPPPPPPKQEPPPPPPRVKRTRVSPSETEPSVCPYCKKTRQPDQYRLVKISGRPSYRLHKCKPCEVVDMAQRRKRAEARRAEAAAKNGGGKP